MPASFHDLKDASVFITGGGSGIGAALTEAFLRQGARVGFVGRSDYSGFADEMAEATDNRPLFLRCDVTDTDALKAAMDRAAEAHGPIRVLVNNAADDMRYDAMEVTPEIWDAQQAVNLKQYFFACQHVAAMMKAAGGGSIISFSSITYLMGAGGLVPYVTANAGIVGMTRALAREWGGDLIRVNAVAPGWVLTDKQLEKWAAPGRVEAHVARQCLPVRIAPGDVAGTVLFLASDQSALMTSQVLALDGGMVMTG